MDLVTTGPQYPSTARYEFGVLVRSTSSVVRCIRPLGHNGSHYGDALRTPFFKSFALYQWENG